MLKVKLLHMQLVRKGDYEVARRILQLLRERRLTLRLGDVDNRTELVLEKAEVRMSYSHDGHRAHAYLP